MADEQSNKFDWSQESRPNPDPTRLTTAQLESATATLRREFEAGIETRKRELEMEIQALRRELEAAINTVNQEIKTQVAQIQHNIEQADNMSAVRHDRLKELWQESHSGFKTLVEQTNIYSAAALANAEVAHEKAIIKAEIASSTQILDVKSRLDLVAKNLEEKIGATDSTAQRLNDRLTGIEARGAGVSESRGVANQQTTHWLSIIAILISAVTVLLYLLKPQPAVPTTFQQSPSYGTQNVNPPATR